MGDIKLISLFFISVVAVVQNRHYRIHLSTMSLAEAGDEVFEASNVRRTYEVTIANFRMITKGAKSTTIVNLLSVDNLKFSLEVNPAGSVCNPGHVGVYLRNNSPVDAIVNYSVTGQNLKDTNFR